jgi:heme/copper-type cytochrome/quinol oxidase subunit 2
MSSDTLVSLAASVCGGAVALFVFSLAFWTARDVAARSRDLLVRAAAVVLVLGLNVFGLVIYVLLRPPETLSEREERELIEELLAREATTTAIRRRQAPSPPTA